MDELKGRLKSLHLSGMADMLDGMADDGSLSTLSAEKVLDRLTIQEDQLRKQRKANRLVRQSGLYYPAAGVAGIIHDQQRRMNTTLLDSLLTCEYIVRNQPVWIMGSSGSGKTYISCVLGKQACLLQYAVRYFSTSELFEYCAYAEKKKELQTYIHELTRSNLIILDDFLLTGVTFSEATYLYELFNAPLDPKRPRTFVIATQLMEEEIRLRLADVSPALSEAIVGRLKARALVLEITGKDMRT